MVDSTEESLNYNGEIVKQSTRLEFTCFLQ